MKRAKVNPGEIVGVIGDTHLPYEHKDYLQFCQDTFDRQEVTRVIHIGDLLDHHAQSFHDSEPGLKGANGEFEDARERLEPWYDAVPKLELVHGNHDRIPARQLTKMGIDPQRYMRPLAEVYEFPEGWTEVEHVFSNGVLYHHGETALGVNGFRNDAKARMVNTVTGHAHGNFGVSYTASDHRLVYGCAVGCGIDSKSMAFAYGKHFKLKPIVGCAVIMDDGKLPVCFPMDLGEKP
ncbi:MAG: metallophosphoesterase [Dehalococcoidia bacterium]